MPKICVIDCGRVSYVQARAQQQANLRRLGADPKGAGELLLLEHEPPVISVGKATPAGHVLISEACAWELGYQIIHADRGGEVTVHGPGQLVAYLNVHLGQYGKDVLAFLRKLERVAWQTAAAFGVQAGTIESFTGLWTGGWGRPRPGDPQSPRKLCSIGVGFKRWVSLHGLCLNVSGALEGFRHVVACGIPQCPVTTLSRECGREVSYAEARDALIRAVAEVFGAEVTPPPKRAFPAWLKIPYPRDYDPTVRDLLRELRLNTVCRASACPNLGECFSAGTATFLILGNVCTRGCAYCRIPTGRGEPVDESEPERLAAAAVRLGLRHVVVTSVDRDDLPDGGAAHWAAVVRALKCCTAATVEVLVPDFRARQELVQQVLAARPDVFGHNVETVAALYPRLRPQGRYRHALEVLAGAKKMAPEITTKSGLLVGMGEKPAEVFGTLRDLREAQVDLVTIGQYLRPGKEQLPVAEFLPPEQFERYREAALRLGFRAAYCGPLVRSSYHAAEMLRA